MRRTFGVVPATLLILLIPFTVLASSGWSLQTTPNPSGAMNTFLTGVSCNTATACTAVGYSISTSETVTTLAERWTGTTWSIELTPNPAGGDSSLSAVDCTGATACTAVGDYFTTSNVEKTLDEHWNGTAWSITTTPNPAGAKGSLLNGVACTATASCIAVGSYKKTSSGNPMALAERWNGTAWSILSTPNPSGNRGVTLNSVGCSSASACTAAGDWFNSSDTEVTLAERWNGTSWSIQTTINPTTHLSELLGVACAAATACMAVGDEINSSFLEVPLVEQWNGTSWSVLSTPSISGSMGAWFESVSCATATGCNSVGANLNSSGVEVTLAEKWNGSAWSIKSTPNPGTATQSFLLAVSCVPTACTATGAYSTSSPPSLNDLTLAEHT